MGFKDYLNVAQNTPGRSQAVDIDDGDSAVLLIDPELTPLDARFGKCMVPVHRMCAAEADGKPPLWKPETFYLTIPEFGDLCRLLPEDGGRMTVIVGCTKEARIDVATGMQAVTQKGKPSYNVFYDFELHAFGAQLSSLNPPAKVIIQAPGSRVVKPRPKPLV